MKISEKYRLEALDCEKRGRDAHDNDIKVAWSEIAIEWHCLSYRTNQSGADRELPRTSMLSS